MTGHQYEGITVTNSSNTRLGDTHVINYYAHKPDYTRYLKVAKGAVFDDRENEKGPLCHPQTRSRLLAEIAQWADDPEGKCIFWLRGAAGTGKSTISRTVAKSFSNKGKLAASFFFNRTIDDCRKADLFVTTIANQLLRNVHRTQNTQELGNRIRDVIHKNPDLPSKTLKTQFENLVLGPLKELGPVGSSTTTLVLAIDALDECDNEDYTGAGPYLERTRMIVGLLGELASVTGIRVRVFITSRPELPIQLGFKHDVPESFHQDVALHEMPPSEIEHDIRVYLEHELKRMQSLYDISPPWPDSETTTSLVHRCNPLFIYAATICRFMDNRRLHPKTQLKKILDSRYKSTNKMEMTYGTVLDQLLCGLDESDCQDFVIRFRRIVGSIILLADPLPVVSLSRFLNDSEDEVFYHLKHLRSVLSVPDDLSADQPITVFHLSFPEYLLDRDGERGQFFIEEQQKHNDLLDCCLQVMASRNQYCLKNDICQLEDPGVLREEVAPETVRENIPRHLEYACMYWVHHLEKAHCPTNETKVYSFLTEFFVHWLEAMSWLGRTEQSVSDVHKLRAVPHSPGSKIALFLEDAERFVAEHKYAIDRAPGQVYVSALLFSPRDSIVKQTFQSEIPKWVLRAPETATTWNAAQRSLHKYRSAVRGICYSQEGTHLAIATRDEVNIWNISSNTLCAVKDDFASEVSCIAFRPANDVAVGLVSGSVAFWDWAHGQHSVENLSKSGVSYISASANGNLVCGFRTGAVYLWKQNIGVLHQWETCWCLTSESWRVQPRIAYSVDGRFVAIIRKQCPDHIDVYDANSGCHVQEICAPKGKVFGSLTILPNNSLLALSGLCDPLGWMHDNLHHADRMQIWNLNTNEKTPVEEVSFNPRSHLRPAMNQSGLLCLHSNYAGLEVWDMRETPVLMHTITTVQQSSFSPDGRYIAAASSGHVTIIDTLYLLTHDEDMQCFQLFKDARESQYWTEATYSPNGSRLGTISSRGRVIVWDIRNGQVVPSRLDPLNPLLEEHYRSQDLSWSVDGRSLVVAMPDKMIVYRFLSEHEPTMDEYSLELTNDRDSPVLSGRYLCCSSRGSYLAMMSFVREGQCDIVMWKWESHSLRHFWTKIIVLESNAARWPGGLTFSPDEKWLAFLSSGKQHYSLTLIDVELGTVKWETPVNKNWHREAIAFDSSGTYIVVGAHVDDEYKTEDESDYETDDQVDDEGIDEDDEGDYQRDNEPATDCDAFVFSVHDGGRLLHSEPIKEWGIEHAKSFSVGFMGDTPVVVEPHDWFRLQHMPQQHPFIPAPANGVSCHVHVRKVDGDWWIMKGDRKKALLPEHLGDDCDFAPLVKNWSSLPHRFCGFDRSRDMPWLIELDCCNCIFPSSFLEMKRDS